MQRAPILFSALALFGKVDAQSPSVLPDISGSWDMITTTWDFDGTNMNFSYFDHHLGYDLALSEVLNDTLWYEVFDGWNNEVGRLTLQGDSVYFKSTGNYMDGYGGYNDPTTRLLYDFSIGIGDTAYYQNNEMDLPVTVIAKDTVYLGGHARVRLSMDNADEWISGMGSRQGLLRPFQFVFECGYDLDQFCGTFSGSGGDTYTACTPIVLQVANEPARPARVFPQPSDGSVCVQVERFPQRYELYNALGELQLSGSLNGPNTWLSIPKSAPGYYVLRLEGSSQAVLVQ